MNMRAEDPSKKSLIYPSRRTVDAHELADKSHVKRNKTRASKKKNPADLLHYDNDVPFARANTRWKDVTDRSGQSVASSASDR